MKFWKTSSGRDVEVGQTYQYLRDDTIVEDATVLGFIEDPLGVPHVRYDLKVRQNSGTYDYGQRTLGLRHFSARYNRTVNQPAASAA